jgi:hypothetical protein
MCAHIPGPTMSFQNGTRGCRWLQISRRLSLLGFLQVSLELLFERCQGIFGGIDGGVGSQIGEILFLGFMI